MEVRNHNQNENFIYDPNISGNDDAFWKEITGTLTATGTAPSAVLRWTSAVAASYSFYRFADITFYLTVPVEPTIGHDRSWGFALPAAQGSLSILFIISGTTFSVSVKDIDGNVFTSKTITWSASWTATPTKYQIRWFPQGLQFLIGDTIVHTYMRKNAPNREIPNTGLPIYIKNDEADNMDLTAIIVSDVHSFT